MSALGNRRHRNIKHIQRYCEKCGGKMHRIKFKFHPKYDGKTGKEIPVVKFYWVCRAADLSKVITRGSEHDGWTTSKPLHEMR